MNNFVNLPVRARSEPLPFLPGNDDARLSAPDPSETLVRIEDLSGWCADLFKGTHQELMAAFHQKDPTFDKFLGEMNARRGPWPMFAALVGELDVVVRGWRDKWPSVLPCVLGLGHLDLDNGKASRVLALMSYKIDQILKAPGDIAAGQRFAAPTTLDHKLNPCFMPSPFPGPEIGISYGRAVNLDGQGTLVCEMIHRHIVYRLDNVKDVRVVGVPVSRKNLSDARQAHLDRLRGEKGCADFGKVTQP